MVISSSHRGDFFKPIGLLYRMTIRRKTILYAYDKDEDVEGGQRITTIIMMDKDQP